MIAGSMGVYEGCKGEAFQAVVHICEGLWETGEDMQGELLLFTFVRDVTNRIN